MNILDYLTLTLFAAITSVYGLSFFNNKAIKNSKNALNLINLSILFAVILYASSFFVNTNQYWSTIYIALIIYGMFPDYHPDTITFTDKWEISVGAYKLFIGCIFLYGITRIMMWMFTGVSPIE